ncbi:putative minor spike protein [Eel River basin pequenovirus]|nr:putative minor spike protein [Eel River basin pequenovirus]
MPFGKILGALATSIGPKLIEGLAGKAGLSSGMAEAAGSAVPAMTKIAGIPLPGHGAMAGQDAAAFMDKAYPGTNPWERLGANAGASIGAAEKTTKSQERMQEKELATRKQVARIQAGATTEAAAIAHGPDAVTSISGRRVDPFDTRTQQDRERLPHEIGKIIQDTRLTRGQATIEEAKAKIADLLAQAGLTKDQYPNLYTALANIGKAGTEKARDGGKRKVTRPEQSKAWTGFIRELRALVTGKAKSFKERRAPIITTVPGSTHYKTD